MSARKKKPADTTTKKARRARGLVRVEAWLDPVIAGALDAMGVIRNETRSQTLRAAVLLLFQMQATRAQLAPPSAHRPTCPATRSDGACTCGAWPNGIPPDPIKIKTSSTYGKTAADIAADAVARNVEDMRAHRQFCKAGCGYCTEKIKTSSLYGKTTADVITDAMARGVSSGMAAALGTNGRGAAKIQPSKGKCKRCGFVRCACIGGVKS